MSFKLDWDVSEAPAYNETAPRESNPDRTQNRPIDQPDTQASRQAPGRFVAGGMRRWWPLAGAALVGVFAAAGLWYFTQAGWQKVTGDVVAAISYEDQAALQGATNRVLNVQDHGNADWLAVRQDETLAKQPAPLPAPMLDFGAAPAQVADLTALDADFLSATVNRQYLAPDGQTFSFALPQFYHRSDGGDWLRSAPPGSFWGNWLDWRGALLLIRFSERDASFVSQAAPVLEQRLAAACAVWNGGCTSQSPVKLYLSGFVGSLEYNPIANTEVRIELGTASGGAVTPADYFLSIPSPQIAGVPTDEAGRTYLADYLSVRLIAYMARHLSSSPDVIFQKTRQAIQALGLTRSDPGYLVSGRQRPTSPLGPGGRLFERGSDTPAGRQDRLTWRVMYYTTMPGDSLLSIAAHFNTSIITLERANPLVNPDSVAVGVKLTIPVLAPASSSSP